MVKIYLKFVQLVANILIKMGIGAMSVTLLGLFLSIIAGVLFWTGHLLSGGILLFFGGFCDNLDGVIARTTNTVSVFGALYDSALDRYGEFFLFLGLYGYIANQNDIRLSLIFGVFIFFALIGSVMVSYVRARSEALGIGTSVGFFQRPARVVTIGLTAIITGITNPIFDSLSREYLHDLFVKIAIVILAIGTNVDAIRRLDDSWQNSKKMTKVE